MKLLTMKISLRENAPASLDSILKLLPASRPDFFGVEGEGGDVYFLHFLHISLDGVGLLRGDVLAVSLRES